MGHEGPYRHGCTVGPGMHRALLHGEEDKAFGDAGYQAIKKRPDVKPEVDWHIAMRPSKRRALNKNDEADALISQAEKQKPASGPKSSIRFGCSSASLDL